MGGELIGLVAVILGMEFPSAHCIPITGPQAAQRRALAAIAAESTFDGAELNQAARSRVRHPAVSGALGYIATLD